MPRAEIIRLDEYRRTRPVRPVVREPGSTFTLIQLFGAPPPVYRDTMRRLGRRLAERRRDRV